MEVVRRPAALSTDYYYWSQTQNAAGPCHIVTPKSRTFTDFFLIPLSSWTRSMAPLACCRSDDVVCMNLCRSILYAWRSGAEQSRDGPGVRISRRHARHQPYSIPPEGRRIELKFICFIPGTGRTWQPIGYRLTSLIF